MIKTIENCQVIKDAIKTGDGYPIIKNGKCEGYCTFLDDEPCDKCKRCRYLMNGFES
jgi:hypothetical protein